MELAANAPAQDAPAAPTILIVDDSPMMRAMVKRVATLTDIPVGSILEAGNGQEALWQLEQHRVDILFTDINMPIMNGVELLRAVARRDDWCHMVRVVITTDGSDARREEVRELSVTHYLQKPFQPEVMRDVFCSVTATHTNA